MKWDFAIGNPPYMESTESESTRMPPVYNHFMDAAFNIAEKVEMITPARFLFNAGYTPKAWNEKMLNDPHFKVMEYETDASKVFANTDIKGGIAISYRDKSKDFGAIEIFTKYPALNSILTKVQKESKKTGYLESIISSPLNFQLTQKMKDEHPHLLDRLRTSAFTALAEIFYEINPNDGYDYVTMIGLLNGKRTKRYVRRDYIRENSKTLDKYVLLLPKANGAGNFGEVLAPAEIAAKGEAYTQTFIGIGAFDSEYCTHNVEKYIKTKFARAMLGVLKITQDCPAPKWKFVPLQDFTDNSDINWNTSIANIDKQLYKKYDLSHEEINFIETHVKEMV